MFSIIWAYRSLGIFATEYVLLPRQVNMDSRNGVQCANRSRFPVLDQNEIKKAIKLEDSSTLADYLCLL